MNFARQTIRYQPILANAGIGMGTSPVGSSQVRKGHGLSPVQREIVQVCESSVQQMGLSRSVGQIFGVIYCSPRPLAFGDVTDCLDISKGSVSQGLRFLRELGAIKLVQVPGDRREMYVAETELRRLLKGVLQTRLLAPLKAGATQLKALKKQLKGSKEPNREFLGQRLSSLHSWHCKALLILPLVQRFSGSDRG